MRDFDLIVVGAGLYGSVVAERVASAGFRVLVVDQRDHVGGGCYTYVDARTNVVVHRYGFHVMHTRNRDVWDYARRFANFVPYTHRVSVRSGGRLYSLPLTAESIGAFFDVTLDAESVEGFLATKGGTAPIESFRDRVVNAIGRELYEAFVRGYTTKQWGRDPSELPGDMRFRLKVRKQSNDRYFEDPYEGLPEGGYTPMVERMLARCDVELDCDFVARRDELSGRGRAVLYTGPLDRFFGFREGALRWRVFEFEFERREEGPVLPVAVVNEQDLDVAVSRRCDLWYASADRETRGTVILGESLREPEDGEDIYGDGRILKAHFDAENQRRIARYGQLAERVDGVYFGGRVADSRYYDMDHTIAIARKTAQRVVRDLRRVSS